MKRIHGKNLAEKLEAEGPGVSRWLAVFESICQAVGYAHRHHIIHRDLKPGNIMVGAFGEVQVMDWGLAKVLGLRPEDVEPGDADSTVLPVVDDSDDNKTQPGSLLGTPAYMAPEQAIGAIELLDCRSDVFGLGAVLCGLVDRLTSLCGYDQGTDANDGGPREAGRGLRASGCVRSGTGVDRFDKTLFGERS
jgi:serine/threonine protein kinase